jgi:hypothetical protein
MQTSLSQNSQQGAATPHPGTVAMYDWGTKQRGFIPIDQYCEQTVALTPTAADGRRSAQFFLVNGKIVAAAPNTSTP